MLVEQGVVRPTTRAVLMGGPARASGSQGVAGGQAIDLQNVGIALSQGELEAMHRTKIGTLLQASLRMGAFYAEVSVAALGHVDAYADAVGPTFQVVDDILDMTANAATLGKTAGEDEANDRPTYVPILRLGRTRALANELHAAVGAATAELVCEIGCEADQARTVRLTGMANLIVRHGH